MKKFYSTAACRGLLVATLALASLAPATAQPGSGGPGPGTPPPAATDVPLDGGASLLLASGLAYGLRRLRRRLRPV